MACYPHCRSKIGRMKPQGLGWTDWGSFQLGVALLGYGGRGAAFLPLVLWSYLFKPWIRASEADALWIFQLWEETPPTPLKTEPRRMGLRGFWTQIEAGFHWWWHGPWEGRRLPSPPRRLTVAPSEREGIFMYNKGLLKKKKQSNKKTKTKNFYTWRKINKQVENEQDMWNKQFIGKQIERLTNTQWDILELL